MATNLVDRAWMSVSGTPGTGNITLGSVVAGNQSFSDAGVVDGTPYPYVAFDGNDWEEGIGQSSSSVTVWQRTTVSRSVISGTAGTTKLTLSSAAQIFLTARAADLADASLFKTGTLDAARLNGGSQYQFYQANGVLQTQSRKLVNTLVASNSASLADLTSFALGYPKYEVSYEALTPVTSGTQIFIQVYNGAYQSSGYQGTALAFVTTAVSQSWTSAIPLHYGTFANNLSGEIMVYGPNLTSSPIQWVGHSSCFVGPSTNQGNIVSGAYATNGALTGFRVIGSSGNISSGTVRIYGLT